MKVYASLFLAGAAAAFKLATNTAIAAAQTKSTVGDIDCWFDGHGETQGWSCEDDVSYAAMGWCRVFDTAEGPINASGDWCNNYCAADGHDIDGNNC